MHRGDLPDNIGIGSQKHVGPHAKNKNYLAMFSLSGSMMEVWHTADSLHIAWSTHNHHGPLTRNNREHHGGPPEKEIIGTDFDSSHRKEETENYEPAFVSMKSAVACGFGELSFMSKLVETKAG